VKEGTYYSEAWSNQLLIRGIIVLILFLVVFFLYFRSNYLVLVVIIFLFVIYFIWSSRQLFKKKILITNEGNIFIPASYFSLNKNNLNNYTLSFSDAGFDESILAISKGNIKGAYIVEGKEKEYLIDLDKPIIGKLNYWDKEHIEASQYYGKKNFICIKFKKPLPFKSPSEWGVLSGGAPVFINFPKRNYPNIDKIYISVNNPQRIIDNINQIIK
jgi:hypothetical protein